MGGCGFWFLLYLFLCMWIAMTLGITSALGILPVCVVVILGVALLRAFLIQAFTGRGGMCIFFRLGVFALFAILLGVGATGGAILVLAIFCILELIVAFS